MEKMRNVSNKMQEKWNGVKKFAKRFVQEEDAIGVVEVVLILVVLVGLVILFKEKITTILGEAFKMVNTDMGKLDSTK